MNPVPPRILLLMSAQTYRADAFAHAATRLGVELLYGVDTPAALIPTYHGRDLPLDFTQTADAIATIQTHHGQRPLRAVMAVDDTGSLLAAHASAALHLPHNDPQAALAARDKHRMRQLLAAGGVATPPFWLAHTGMGLAEITTAVHAQIGYPCVVKPTNLSGSRGVMRVDDDASLGEVVARLTRLLNHMNPTATPHPFLIEGFIPGVEVALEGMLTGGELQLLALFDKPDPLDGPFFEETIYVTPSRLPAVAQAAILATTAASAQALGLRTGPIHAELRYNAQGAWLVEMAGRSIGGLCSQTLRFGVDSSLEELILRQATGQPLGDAHREGQARGVMMIPIPAKGLLRGYQGVTEALAIPGIEGVEITASLHYPILPLPEGDSYLGFIFAHGETAEITEAALRTAFSQLHFEIEPYIELESIPLL